MGLDSVELVIRFEDAFGLNIPDDEACRMRTPRDVIEYVMAHVEKAKGACLSQQVFYALRRDWSAKLKVSRMMIRPETSLEDVVPKKNRRAAWVRLCENASWHQFELTRPKWMRVALCAAVLISFVWLLSEQSGSIALLGASGLAFSSYFATLPFKTNFPKNKSHIADVVRFSLLDNPNGIIGQRKAWTRGEVAEVVRIITLDETGLNPSKYREDARFVDDLGID